MIRFVASAKRYWIPDSARPGATGCGYATVFTAYKCLAFHHRILTCQVWARGLGQGHNISEILQLIEIERMF